MPPDIDVTVAAVIERDARFLMVEELVGGRHVFNQPAGHVENGETLVDAVVREVLEETGYRFNPTYFLGIFSWLGESRSYLRIAFTGDAETPKNDCTLDEGIIATHWLSQQELAQRSARLRSPMVLNCIARYDEGIQYPLSAINELLADTKNFANIA